MPLLTKKMKSKFSVVSLKAADLTLPLGICVAELILELQAKFPLLEFPQITSIEDLNWIGTFLYVNDMVLITRSPAQLQSMIDACQDWAGRSRMRINHDKTEVMMFYELEPPPPTSHQIPLHFSYHHSLSPLTTTPNSPTQNPPTFKYLGLKLDSYLTMEADMKHICRQINAVHQTVGVVAHSLRYDSSVIDRGI